MRISLNRLIISLFTKNRKIKSKGGVRDNIQYNLRKDLDIFVETEQKSITHTSATLIDNIYVRHTIPSVHSDKLCSNISDHLPIFCLIKNQMSR